MSEFDNICPQYEFSTVVAVSTLTCAFSDWTLGCIAESLFRGELGDNFSAGRVEVLRSEIKQQHKL